MKLYHVLLERQEGVWAVAFGDYVKARVNEERQALRESGVKAKDLMIIRSDDDQESINLAVQNVNGGNADNSRMHYEFDTGDIVTFQVSTENLFDTQISETVIKAKVLKRIPRNCFTFDREEVRVGYVLEGIDKPLLTHCSANCIKQSIYFNKFEEWQR